MAMEDYCSPMVDVQSIARSERNRITKRFLDLKRHGQA